MVLRSRRGFTLVEVMMSTVIMMVVVSTIYLMLTAGRVSWQTNSLKLSLRSECVKALREMDVAIREASPGQLFASGGVLVCRIPGDGDNDGDAIDPTGGVEWGALLQFSLGGTDGEQLIRTDGLGSNRIVANHITGLQFAVDDPGDPGEVAVTVTASDTTPSGFVLMETLERTISLRNEG